MGDLRRRPRRIWEPTAGRLERGPLSRLLVRFTSAMLAGALVLGAASLWLDGPLRRSMEGEINRRLNGYSVRVPDADFRLFALAVTLRDVEIRQNANPEPPVAILPRLRASIRWKALLSGKLVADFLFERPRFHVNLLQLRTEARSPTKLEDRGWQEAALAILPLKIDLLRVEDGALTYIDQDPSHPLVLTAIRLKASDIRNVRSRKHAYPSPVSAEAVVFDSGRAVVDGHADFLAEPHPGVHVRFALRDVPLESLRPIVSRANLRLRGGVLSTAGEVEYAPDSKSVHLADLTLRGLRLDSLRREPAPAARETGGVVRTGSGAAGRRELAVRLDRVRLLDADVGLVNETSNPPYRVFLDQAELTLEDFANRPGALPGTALLTGRFMGSGRAKAKLRLRPDPGDSGPAFDLDAAVEETDMTKMNPLLRAHGNFDVVKGQFSLFSEVHVEDGTVRGYVKPLFRDMEVYDRRQEKGKSIFKKFYEGIVDVVAELLENQERDEVATVTELRGRIASPKSSTLQVLAGLLENAFFKAILPGFERSALKSPRGRKA